MLKLAGPVFPPYYDVQSEGGVQTITGPLADILKLLAETAHYGWTGELFPAARLMDSLKRGEVDCSLLVRNNTLDTAETMLRSDRPLAEMVLNLYSLKTPVAIASRDDLKHRQIIVIRGYGYGGLRSWMEDPGNDITLVESNSHGSAVAMLAAARAPFALLYDVNYEAGLKTLSASPDNIVTNGFQRVPLYLYVSKARNPEAQTIMDRMMAAYGDLLRTHVLSPPNSRPEEALHKAS